MAIQFEVGAAFVVEAAGAIASLERLGEAFTGLDEAAMALKTKLSTIGETAFSGLAAATTRAMTEIDRLIARAAELDRVLGGTGAGMRGPGAGGGRGGPTREAERDLLEARRNATADNNNINQIYAREHAAAVRENDEFDRRAKAQADRNINPNGPYGPQLADGYRGYDEAGRQNDSYNTGQRMNAEEEDRNRNRIARAREQEHARANRSDMGIIGQVAPIVAGLSGWKAGENASKEEQDINLLLSGIGITAEQDQERAGWSLGTSRAQYPDAVSRMRRLAGGAAVGTKFSEQRTAEILRESIPSLFLSGEKGLEGAETVGPLSLRLGEASEQRHRGEAGSEAVAATEIAHLAGKFDARDVVREFDAVNEAARVTNTSIMRQQMVLRYGLPIAQAAGIDPATALYDITSAEVRLGNTTTAGSGYSRFLMGAQTFHGAVGHGSTASRQSEARQAEKGLHDALMLEDPKGQVAHEAHMKLPQHDAALVRLKIYDEKGKLRPEAMDEHGNEDFDKVKGLIADYREAHGVSGPTGMFQTGLEAFGVQGWRYAQPYQDRSYVTREQEQRKTQIASTTIEQELKVLQSGTLQNFEQMVARLSDTGNIIATVALPGLNKAFSDTTTAVQAFNTYLRANPGVARTIANAAIGAGVGAAYGLIGGAVGGPFGMVGGALSGAVIGGATGAGYGAAAEILPKVQRPTFTGMTANATLGEGAAFAPPPPPVNNNVTNNMNLTVSGLFDEAMKSTIIAWVTGTLKTAMTTATTDSAGSHQSIYTQPAGF